MDNFACLITASVLLRGIKFRRPCAFRIAVDDFNETYGPATLFRYEQHLATRIIFADVFCPRVHAQKTSMVWDFSGSSWG